MPNKTPQKSIAISSRISNATMLSSRARENRQVQVRIRDLQQRTNTLYEELSRSSLDAKSAAIDIERAYTTITNEYQEQRQQLLERLHNVKKNIKQSTEELLTVRKSLNTAQSFRLSKSPTRYSLDLEEHEMNATVDDIERTLNNISHQIKQFRFIPSNGHAISKKLGTIRTSKYVTNEDNTIEYESTFHESYSMNNVAFHKLYTIDLDISANFLVSSFDKRIFLCNTEGEVRIYSYSQQLRRQPILTERFHLSNTRLVSSFTVTKTYLIVFETDTEILALNTHHGALLIRLYFPYDPIMIIHCNYNQKDNRIWTCSRTKQQCFLFNLNHSKKEVHIIDQFDLRKPVSNASINPIAISADETARVAVHDANTQTGDRLLVFSNHHVTPVSLDFIKYTDKPLSSRIQRVLLVPKHPNLIIIVYAPQSTTSSLNEIHIVDIKSQPAQILHHITDVHGVQSIDLTFNNELVYTVTAPSNKRMPPKMHVYSIIN